MAYTRSAYRPPADPSAPKRRGNPNWNPNYKKSTVVPGSLYKPCNNLSDEQTAIRDAVVNGSGSIIVDAYAGTGKTTLCVETMYAVKRVHPHLTQGYIIFASRNKDEAKGKCPTSVHVSTAHSFGLSVLTKTFGKITVDKEKTARIASALVGPDDDKAEMRYMVEKAIDLGKDYLAEEQSDIEEIVEKHSLEMCGLAMSEFAAKVLEGMRVSKQQTRIVSFSDMVWLPLVLNLSIPTFDILYGDECQDLNPARIELMLRALGQNGRFVGVGDEFQSIFQFSGADRHALRKLKERTNAVIMPLHRTFRCGKAIVKEAQVYVPEYVAAETNSEGEVKEVTEQEMMSDKGASPGDFILSRTNAPITKIALALIKMGKKCNIQGRDLGKTLTYMIKRSKAKTVIGFQEWLDTWASAEIERLTAKNKNSDHIVDKKECLEAFCEGERSLDVVVEKIRSLFDEAEPDETHRIILSTVHRAKGLERNRVFLLEDSFGVRTKTEEDVIAERNVRYVGITRARNNLFYVL